MDLDDFLNKKAKKANKKKAQRNQDGDDKVGGVEDFEGLGKIDPPPVPAPEKKDETTEKAAEPPAAPEAAADAEAAASPPSAPVEAPAAAPEATGEAAEVVNLGDFVKIKAVSTTTRKTKTWEEMKRAQEKAAAAAAGAEGASGDNNVPSPSLPSSPAEEVKPKKFVARGHSGATGQLDSKGNAVAFSTENLPSLDEAFAEDGKAKKMSAPGSPEPEHKAAAATTATPEPEVAPAAPASTGKYVPPSRVGGSTGAYKPPTGAYKPPEKKVSEVDATKPSGEEKKEESAPASTGKYVPPSRAADSSAGAYKPPSGPSAGAYKPPTGPSAGAYKPPSGPSAGAYKPPEKKVSEVDATKPSGEEKKEESAPASTGKYVPPSRAAGSSAGAYKPPSGPSAGAYKPPTGGSSAGAYKPPSKR